MLTGLLMIVGALVIGAVFVLVAGLIGVAMAGGALVELRKMLRRHRDAADGEPDRRHDA